MKESYVASQAVDLLKARAKAEEAITALLSRPDGESEKGWLGLLDDAGHAAWEAQDPRATRDAWTKVLEVRSRTEPEDHPEIQMSRGNLAGTMYLLGDYSGARALSEKVVEVLSRTLSEDRVELQRARLNLALAIQALGDLAGARTIEGEVLEVLSRTLPDDDVDLQTTRENLAGTMYTLGDLAGARALYEKVLEVRSRTLPADHPDLQTARANLAVTLGTLGDNEGARAFEEQVLEVRTRTLPDDHLDLQNARLNYASTIQDLGDPAGARALEEKVVEIYSRSMPDDFPELQMARENLAKTMKRLGDLQGARALLERVLEVRSKTLPDDYPDLQLTREYIALTLAATEAAGKGGSVETKEERAARRAEFVRLAGSFTRATARSARRAVLTASSREAEEQCANSLGDLGLSLSFAEGLGVFTSDADLGREAFVLSEETRGAALASAHLARSAILDPRYARFREEMRLASDDLAQLSESGAGADEMDAARTRREKAERQLVRLAHELSTDEAGIREFDPAALSKSLSEREALIGYRRYTRAAHEAGGGIEAKSQESLCAFVLRSGDRLQRIELGPIEPIERAAERWRQAIGVRLERGVSVDPGRLDESVGIGDQLRQLVFDPLTGALQGVERLVVALDDVLHLVPLDALPLATAVESSTSSADPSAKSGSTGATLLGDRWRIETRSTFSELAWKENSPLRGEALLALGGASFNSAPLQPSAEETASLDDAPSGSPLTTSLLRGGAWERGFGPLTQSGPEAHGVAALYGEAFGEKRPAIVLEKRKASRDSLTELAPKARFLHIATHGWFAPESVRSTEDPEPLDKKMGFGVRMSGEERVRGMSPMLLCGLALAGANLKEDKVGRAPGLVTAEELSTLDLSNCELVVLSACDTNVGERRAGQGVASLQKALHMAGARTVITSLWKVPDEATKDLMLDFYRRLWVEKKPKWQALWEAKKKLRDAKDERGMPMYMTRDWAAWVLTGDPN